MLKFVRRAAILAALAGTCALVALTTGVVSRGATASASASAPCQLGSKPGQVKHVIYLQFDNTHFRRDVPNVASDLEQMPHLLNFLKGNGTLFTNDHTILISHTAGGILSSLTGLYPDRSGMTVSNSYAYFDSANPLPTFPSGGSFKYWTDAVNAPDATHAGDPLPNMVTTGGKNTPAPWVPYTRAGCDFGGVGTANIELENTNTSASGDMTRVFGAGSPEWLQAQSNPQLAQTNYVGIAIHCAVGNSGVCHNQYTDPSTLKADSLPDEPNPDGSAGAGYSAQALYGAKYVDPSIAQGNACVPSTAGAADPIADPKGNCGFPGFDGMLAKNTLGYVAAMQEAGVEVTYGYISDAHDFHVPNTGSDSFVSSARGPGEAEYQAQLKSYDDAFAAFFQNLAAHGIDRSNTLFVVTVDEGDHFAGGVGTPDPANPGALSYTHANCAANAQGILNCPSNQIGEVNANLRTLTGRSDFAVHSDDAPTVYVNGQPDRTSSTVRSLEHTMAGLQLSDPYVNNGAKTAAATAFADPVEEQALHMVNADPKRTPTFTLFGNPDFFFTAGSDPTCGSNPCVSPGFAWNHGDIQDEIGNTWAGIVGPGVAANGVDSSTWTDHTNLRPTMLTLLGLHDDYVQDGRVLVEALTNQATPHGLIAHRATVDRLGAAYEQLNASFGSFAEDTLTASTRGIESDTAGDQTYNQIENAIASLTSQRDAVASQIKAGLNAAAFDGQALNEPQAKGWIAQAQSLIDQAHALATSP
jgi:hypothetical protein